MIAVFDQVDALIEGGEYEMAFKALEEMAANPDLSKSERADVFQVMGSLVQISPALGQEDECGLSYFKKSLALVPDHLYSLYGVVVTFGERFPDHQDVRETRNAIARIRSHPGITNDMVSVVDARAALLEKMQP